MSKWLFNFTFSVLLAGSQAMFFLATALKISSLGGDERTSGQVGTIFGIVFMLASVLCGFLSDRIGRKPTMVLSLLLATAGCLVMMFASSIPYAMVVVGAYAISNAGAWPAFEAWLADRATGPLSREMAAFNLGWSSGAALGFVFSGLAEKYGADTSFKVAAGVSLLLAIVSLVMSNTVAKKQTVVQKSTASMEPPANPRAIVEARGRLLSVWLANVAMWFSWSIIVWIFPVQAQKTIGLEEGVIGNIMSFVPWTEMAVFIVLLLFPLWHLSVRLRVGLQVVALFGFATLSASLAVLEKGPLLTVLLCCAMAAFGVGLASTYAASLIVSATDIHARGTRTGMHETLVGFGTVFGPLAGGYAAAWAGDWLTYVISFVVVTAALVGQAIIAMRVKRHLFAMPEGVVVAAGGGESV